MTTNHDALIDALYDLADCYPRYELLDRTAQTYARKLSDLPLPAVMAAIERCGDLYTFFPALAEIRKEVGAHAADTGEIAESEWTKVLTQVRRAPYGRGRELRGGVWFDPPEPHFDSEITRRTVESIGWKQVCQNPIEEVRKEFIFGYRKFKDTMVSEIQRGNIGALDNGPAIDEPHLTALPRKAG